MPTSNKTSSSEQAQVSNNPAESTTKPQQPKQPINPKSSNLKRFNLIAIPLTALLSVVVILNWAPDKVNSKLTEERAEALKDSFNTIPIEIAESKEHKLQIKQLPSQSDLKIRERRAPSVVAASYALKATSIHRQQEVIDISANNETYQAIDSNNIKLVSESPVSTFSVDVDTGGYSNIRRMLKNGQLPKRNQVRIEEMINYFDYAYASPTSKSTPFNVETAMMPSPWNKNSHILRIGVKGFEESVDALPASNLVFLVDVSGSMHDSTKLPLVKQSLKLLTKNLREDDRVAIVTYAGNTQVVLPSVSGKDKRLIINALERLNAGGSTAGASGLKLAYQQARAGFIKGGNNRIVMLTDGDFNVGLNSVEAMVDMVTTERASGVYLSTIGFGQGNYREDMMEQMANHGNGVYFYIDSYKEAYRVFERNLRSNLFAIAKDVKIQVEFNPERIKEYRLVGYENRMLNREDFNNDKVDAGDIGQGHSVTALYEVTLSEQAGKIDPLRYADKTALAQNNSLNDGNGFETSNQELAFVKLRYKPIGSEQSQLLQYPVYANALSVKASDNLKLAVATASFGELLRNSSYLSQHFDYQGLSALLNQVSDPSLQDVAELKELVQLASSLN